MDIIVEGIIKKCPNLLVLDLSHNRFTKEGLNHLLRLFQNHKTLKWVDFTSNQTNIDVDGDECKDWLCSLPNDVFIKLIFISKFRINREEWQELYQD
jgi:Ran GTPase-activating protein (RanGAP) involved in mRNA processing and transport